MKTPTAVEIRQVRACDLAELNGPIIRLPGDTEWYLLVYLVDGQNGPQDENEGVVEVAEQLDDFYVLLCLNDLPNRLTIRDGKVFSRPHTLYKAYDPPLRMEALFAWSLVDVQVEATGGSEG